MSALLEAAIRYADLGYAVFPCATGLNPTPPTAGNAGQARNGSYRNTQGNGRLQPVATCHDESVIDVSGGHGTRTHNPVRGN